MSEQSISLKSNEIRNETQEYANTKGRVANVLDDINSTKANKTEVAQGIIDQNQNLQSHINNSNNPHNVTKNQIGLNFVNNTSDLDKPISTATQNALNNISVTITTSLDDKINKKADALENATGIGFAGGAVYNTPYFYHKTGGYVLAATQDWSAVTFVANSQKAQPNGVATLDGGGKIPVSQLPNSVMELQGNWNASTNTPTLADGTGNAGDVYEVIVAGTKNLGSGNISFNVGDWAVYGADEKWYKSVNSNEVTSVNGMTGTVVLDKTHVGLGNVDNTSDLNKNVLSATKWTTPRNFTIGNISKTVDGTSSITWSIAELTATLNLDNFVTLNTPQDIVARKTIASSSGNDYLGASLEVQGNGVTNTFFPALSFHQPGVFAGVMSYRGEDYGFYFMNSTGAGYKFLNALGYRKEGSDENYVLTGAGGHKPISDFATTAQLSNYVTIDTPQTIVGSKTFALTSEVRFIGTDLNEVKVYKSTTGDQGIVAGHEFKHYDTSWLVGNKRGGSSDSLGYAFQFSSDGGANYSEQVLIQPDGNILTSNFGSASIWNAKVSQSQLANYLPLSGGVLTGEGRIDSQGTITIQQASTNNATGLFWEKMDNTDRMAGIGALTTGDNLDTLYMGWGAYPWLSSESFTVSPNFIRYKNNIVWHEGNLPNPVTQNQLNDYPTFGNLSNSLSTKVDALEEVKGLGFAGSDFKYPYIRRLDGNSTILSTRDFVISSTENKINSEANAVAIGFVGGAPDTPYIKHSNGTNTPVATETWSSNNFVTLSSFQNITGVKTYTVSPKVPFAIESDDAIPLGQAEEVAQTRINDTFVEIIYKNSATDLTFDFNDYPNAKVVTIACKGNNFQNIRIENMPRSVTLKIMNGSASLSPTIYFDGGTIATGLGNATWCGFYRDQDSDIFKNNVNGTNII